MIKEFYDPVYCAALIRLIHEALEELVEFDERIREKVEEVKETVEVLCGFLKNQKRLNCRGDCMGKNIKHTCV